MLQKEVFGASGVVVNNRNAIHYGGKLNEPSTTSYITQAFSPEHIPGLLLPGKRYYFGGDTHFGRFVAKKLQQPAEAARIERTILSVTGGAPLILNLEGVIVSEVPERPAYPLQIGMCSKITLEWLRRLNVCAVSLENNHSHDFGEFARERMKQQLESAGVIPLLSQVTTDMGPFCLGVATDLENLPAPSNNLLTAASFARWKPSESKPFFVFFHCGTEYAFAPTIREKLLASWAQSRGASLILGCHTHRPSQEWESGSSSLRWFSMGNMLFDQNDNRNGGGLIEVRFLDQGTWTARWIPLGNLYSNRITSLFKDHLFQPTKIASDRIAGK